MRHNFKLKNMKTTTYAKVCEAAGLQFLYVTESPVALNADEYYAIMVTGDDYKNPHVAGVDAYTHEPLIGVERPTNMGCYISKNFRSRRNGHRGNTIVVRVDDPSAFTIL